MATANRVDRPAAQAKISSEILDRQPPRNLEAERGVLGSILLLPEVCDEVALAVRPEDFYDDANRRLFGHLQAMHDEGRRIDTTLLVERLRSAGDFELVGGEAYLAEVLQSVPTSAHAVYYAQIVRDKATLRALIHTSTEILRDAYDHSASPRELLNQAEHRVFGILDAWGTGEVAEIRDILQQAMLRLESRLERENVIGGVETGFGDLDAITGGLHNSELIILAARPSMGKTALALNMAEHVVLNTNLTTLFVSLEMSSLELADRMLCSLAKVNGLKLRTGRISVDDRRKIVEKTAELSKAPLFVDDTPSRTVTEIAAVARRLKRKNELGLIVIDYLQLIEPDNPRDPRQEQVARIARRLKGLAREINVPVLCLAQLNRQADTKDSKPRLSHLRESGAIEQDADVVVFIHRDDYQQNEPSAGSPEAPEAEIIIAKQRNGPVGILKLLWMKEYAKFVDLSHRQYDEHEQFADGAF